MSKPEDKSAAKPATPAKAPKPLTGAALDRALKAGAGRGPAPVAGDNQAWSGKGRRSDAPASRIRYIPKRGK